MGEKRLKIWIKLGTAIGPNQKKKKNNLQKYILLCSSTIVNVFLYPHSCHLRQQKPLLQSIQEQIFAQFHIVQHNSVTYLSMRHLHNIL
jgi:hypothetical protein